MIPLLNTNKRKIAGLVLGIGLLCVSFVSSIVFGVTEIRFVNAVYSFLDYNALSDEHVIIQTTRVPRALIAAVVGSNLAVAGALMQVLTRNPLASPSIFGINAGAIFCVIVAITLFKLSALQQLMWVAFGGAALAALAVYVLGSIGRGGLTPLKTVLAGAAVSALFSAFSQGMLALNEAGLQDVLFWLAGSVSGRTTDILYPVLPYMAVGGIAAFTLARQVTILASGDDIAKGLGQRTVLIKCLLAVTVVLLAGSSVAVAGSIGFIGLVIPHIARYFVGVDYRWTIPYCALLGAILLLWADILIRFPIPPQELPVGVVTAFIGTPFFIYIARRGFRSE
ncbi:FecCD family ABC transporter permease [Paenibacillus turpanensis]|uniref:FecCD family ABC transporter permease n=1 Tax=Paenibacillus turpanensis TaxID=2689078 RepID=UPI00140A385E|nr:iron ABC transporter permease [Paenibacillus turpanensis]